MPGSNTIYGSLVESQTDFLGILAYSVYKRQKTELIARLRERTPEGELPEAELRSFYELSRSETQLTHYRAQAAALAEEFAIEVAGQEMDAERERLDREYRLKLESQKPKFWSAVFASVVASFIFTLLLGLLVFFSWSLKQGPKDLIETVFDVKITPHERQTEPPPRQLPTAAPSRSKE